MGKNEFDLNDIKTNESSLSDLNNLSEKTPPKRVAIIYFSGTGNTEKVANLYFDEFEKRGIKCDLFSLPLKTAVDFSAYDLLGVGYPVHAFNTPEIVLSFVKTMQKTPLKRVFVFKTSGEPLKLNDVSSLKLIKLLAKRGYLVQQEYHYIMPYDIIFRHSDYMADKMWKTTSALVPINCKEILHGVKTKKKKFFLGGTFAFIMSIEHFGARLNGRFYKVKSSCIKCGKCIKICPTENITEQDGKIVFGKKCIMCTRCAFFCPTDSIKLGLFDGWRVNGEYSFKDLKSAVVAAEDSKSADDNDKNCASVGDDIDCKSTVAADKNCEEIKESISANGKHEKYCKKAYAKYFKNAEEIIKNAITKMDD